MQQAVFRAQLSEDATEKFLNEQKLADRLLSIVDYLATNLDAALQSRAEFAAKSAEQSARIADLEVALERASGGTATQTAYASRIEELQRELERAVAACDSANAARNRSAALYEAQVAALQADRDGAVASENSARLAVEEFRARAVAAEVKVESYATRLKDLRATVTQCESETAELAELVGEAVDARMAAQADAARAIVLVEKIIGRRWASAADGTNAPPASRLAAQSDVQMASPIVSGATRRVRSATAGVAPAVAVGGTVPRLGGHLRATAAAASVVPAGGVAAGEYAALFGSSTSGAGAGDAPTTPRRLCGNDFRPSTSHLKTENLMPQAVTAALYGTHGGGHTGAGASPRTRRGPAVSQAATTARLASPAIRSTRPRVGSYGVRQGDALGTPRSSSLRDN